MRLLILLIALALGGCGGESPDPAPSPAPVAPPPLDVPFSVTDIEVGDGAPVESGHLVAINFVGHQYDPEAADNRGTELFNDGEAQVRIGSGGVVPGVDRAVTGMRVGGKREAVIPPELAFGEAGTQVIPPNATLLLEIDLVAAEEAGFSATDLEVGTGAPAKAGDSLGVVYTGWLYDLLAEDRRGAQFDANTADNPLPVPLGTGAVIPGWERGLNGMRLGGRRRLVIPHDLAYGSQGFGAVIPGYATLLFDVELVSIQ